MRKKKKAPLVLRARSAFLLIFCLLYMFKSESSSRLTWMATAEFNPFFATTSINSVRFFSIKVKISLLNTEEQVLSFQN